MLRYAGRRMARAAAAAAAAAGPRGRAFASLAQVPTEAGGKLHGFTVLRSKHVPELELTAVHLQHDKTGAEHLHIAREDANNVFSIGFKTNAPDDTGVPHILEHTTLCGSEKYPIRDPFFKMLPRTLSNFMNAFTASDHTFYPFATTNRQDFRNLMSVYMDATLHPLLKATDFAQEGWRIGLEEGGEKPVFKFKGVVYNEMKGQMSDAGYLFYIRFQDHMFPAMHNAGGDPQKMTDLTYEQLRQFHAEHYHPSNAKLFTYGDIPLAEHLHELNKQLGTSECESESESESEPAPRDAEEIRRPIDLAAASGSQSVVVAGPTDPLVDASRQCKTSVSWTLGDDPADVVESFALSLVSALLLDGYGSPLYRGLIESGLGTDWSANTGYDGSGRVGIFSVGLTGVQEADVARVGETVQAVLQAVRERGFERAKIDGYLHQLELGLKHKTASFGVSLLQRLKPKWFAGVDPFAVLAWNDTIAALEARLAEGGYLEGLLDRYLLGRNTLTFTMVPSAAYGDELAREEEARLAGKVDGLGAAAQEQLQEREAVLLAEQTRASSDEEDLRCLPSVHVADIPRQKKTLAAAATATAVVVERDTTQRQAQVQWREAPTNGLTYFRAINELDGLSDELRPLVPLFADAVMRLGTRALSTEQLEDAIKLTTGGLSVGYHAAAHPSGDVRQAAAAAATSEGLVFGGMALDRNVPAMLALLRALVLETDFDGAAAEQHVRQLLQAASDGVVSDIASSGHSFARRRAEAGLGRMTSARLREQVSGLEQVQLVTALASRPGPLDDVLAKLKAIQRLALLSSGGDAAESASGRLRVAVTCGSESARANESALDGFLAALPTAPRAPRAPIATLTSTSTSASTTFPAKTFFPLPYQVSYGALVVPTVAYTAAESAALQVLAALLTHKHLHHEIREKGGAYGGGAYAQPLDGVFGFYAYRDPNPARSLAVMRGAGRWAAERAWTATDLEEAKLSVFQGVDAPRSVDEEGMGRFLYGITDAMRQARREQLLDVGPDDVRAAAQRFLVDGLARGVDRAAFLGPRQDWVAADGGWTVEEMKTVQAAAAAAASEQ